MNIVLKMNLTSIVWSEAARPTGCMYRVLVIDDRTEQELIALLSQWQIYEAFRKSPTSRWLFLSGSGIHEVDDKFGRGNALTLQSTRTLRGKDQAQVSILFGYIEQVGSGLSLKH